MIVAAFNLVRVLQLSKTGITTALVAPDVVNRSTSDVPCLVHGPDAVNSEATLLETNTGLIVVLRTCHEQPALAMPSAIQAEAFEQ